MPHPSLPLVSNRSERLGLTFLFFTVIIVIFASFPTFADDAGSGSDSSEGIPYDRLVDQLSQQTKAKVVQPTTVDFLDEAKIHAGVAYANSIYSLQLPKGAVGMSQSGFEVSLGIDLLSDRWAGEVSFLNLAQTTVQNAQVSASEFDLRFFYHAKVAQGWGYRAGAGIGSRNFHLAYIDATPGGDFVVPTSVLFGGLEAYVTDQFSVGADAALRTALVDDTPARTSLDLMIKVNGKF